MNTRWFSVAAVLLVVLAGCGGATQSDGADVSNETLSPSGTTADATTAANATDAAGNETTTDGSMALPNATNGTSDTDNSSGATDPATTAGESGDDGQTDGNGGDGNSAGNAGDDNSAGNAGDGDDGGNGVTETAGPASRTTASDAPTTQSDAPTTTSTSAPTTSDSRHGEWEVTVVGVVDGDTLSVRFPDGHTEDVRLLGVDAPEINGDNQPTEFAGVPDTIEGKNWLRDWGYNAAERAESRLKGETVTIRTDDGAAATGEESRLLVYLTHDGTLYNRELVADGYARVSDQDFSKRDTFETLQSDAQSADDGVWGYGSGSNTTTTETTASMTTSTAVTRTTAGPSTTETTTTTVDSTTAVTTTGSATTTDSVTATTA
jgi:endonuclease YncB( thermonuclease family)